MKKIFKLIRNIIIIILLIGLITLGLDYLRISSGTLPIFNINDYNENTRIQSFNGILYTFEREVVVTKEESLSYSPKITFKILTKEIKIERNNIKETTDITIVTKDEETCSESKLYFANEKIKVYTYCLDEISIKNNHNNKKDSLKSYLEKDVNIINKIDFVLAYTGIAKDGSTLMYENRVDDTTTQGLTMFRCNKTNIDDIYFAPKGTSMQNDFCTYKDDDLKFMFEIVDENENTNSDTTEVIYEDNNFKYELIGKDPQHIFITTLPARGKEETKTPLMDILNSNKLTIDDLIEKGLEVNRVNKNEENK